MVKKDVLPEKVPRPPSKKERLNILLEKIDNWLLDGWTMEEIAIGKLSEKQWDFLVDSGVDTDNYVLTAEQKANLKAINQETKKARAVGLNYKKQYPQNRQDLFNNLIQFLTTQGATIQEREKTNFRDVAFEIDGKKYSIILQATRTPKTKKGE